MDRLTFRVLGPVEVLRNGESVALGNGVLVSVLAALLLRVGQAASADVLADFVWGEKSPEHPRAAVHSAIARLRRLIGEEAIETSPIGYRVPVTGDCLDLLRFERLTAAAAQAESAADLETAISLLQEGLELWREPLLGNVEAPGCLAVAATLADRYLVTAENWADLCLRGDRYAPVIQRLSPLAQDHPFRERLVGQLMIALFQVGRQADALAHYELLRESLLEELGIGPNRQLQDLHLRILRADPAIAGGSLAPTTVAVNVPRQLPPGIADFTGRQVESAAVCAALGAGDPAVIVIAGQGGVGKTALAVHCARRSAPDFPEGQLYADLRGADGHCAEPQVVLASFLRSLGVASQAIPERAEDLLAMYRSLLADRRVLVVLDNAAGESQVWPLLPGGPGCAVIVTSRSRLTGLPGTQLIDLDAFDDAYGLDLFARIVGAKRVAAEQEHAEEIVRRCGGLPLALRIAGARLAARPHWRVARLAERLADTRRRLDELSYGDLDIRATVTLSYVELTGLQKALLRRLSLLDTADFATWTGAALLDISPEEAEELLDALVDARLLDVTPPGMCATPHYRLHDLVRAYAQERAAAEESAADRDAALARALGGWLALAERAHREVHGGDYTILHGTAARWRLPEAAASGLITGGPIVWLDGERTAIRDAVRQAANLGLDELCWDLAWTAATLFEARGYYDDWAATQQWALSAVERAGNVRGTAAMLQARTTLLVYRQDFARARSEAERAVALFAQVSDWRGHALSLCRLAYLDNARGFLDSALSRYQQAREGLHAHDRYMEAFALRGLAQVYMDLNDHNRALDCLTRARDIFDEIDSGRGRAQVLHVLGQLYLRQCLYHQAESTFREFLGLCRELGESYAEMHALHWLGVALARSQQDKLAAEVLGEALAIAELFSDRLLVARTQLELGKLDIRSPVTREQRA